MRLRELASFFKRRQFCFQLNSLMIVEENHLYYLYHHYQSYLFIDNEL